MKKTFSMFALVVCLAAMLAGCGWNPSVTAVPVTAPWDSMNLPIKEDAVVWASSATELKVVHKAPRPQVVAPYFKAIQDAGWKLLKKTDDGMDFMTFEKDGKTLEAEVYDFENTGVILTLK